MSNMLENTLTLRWRMRPKETNNLRTHKFAELLKRRNFGGILSIVTEKGGKLQEENAGVLFPIRKAAFGAILFFSSTRMI